MIKKRADLKNRFLTGMYPTEDDFSDVFDSYFHKDDQIPAENLKSITNILNENNKYILEQINNMVGGKAVEYNGQDLSRIQLTANKHHVSINDAADNVNIGFADLSGIVGITTLLIRNVSGRAINVTIPATDNLIIMEESGIIALESDEVAKVILTGFGDFQTISYRKQKAKSGGGGDLLPDPFERGKKGSVHVWISEIGSELDGVLFQAWDFDTMQELPVNSGFQGTYKTIVIGEHDWMSDDLQAIYRHRWSTDYSWLNFTEENIDVFYNSYHPAADESRLNVLNFRKFHGSWFTLLPSAVSYTITEQYKVRDKKDGELLSGWLLPELDDIYQLIGQAPRTTGDVKRDVLAFVGCSKQDAPPNYETEWFDFCRNISGLKLTPLGGCEPSERGPLTDNFYMFKKMSALRVRPYQQYFQFSVNSLQYTNKLYHYTQVRYMRRLTAEEVGYRLVIDEPNDAVLMLAPDAVTELPELPVGMERGIALRYMNRAHRLILKKYSEIKAEAFDINNAIVHHYI